MPTISEKQACTLGTAANGFDRLAIGPESWLTDANFSSVSVKPGRSASAAGRWGS